LPVTIESLAPRMQIFILEHEGPCGGEACACVDTAAIVAAENPRTGELARRRVTRQVPGSLTLPARGRREDLPATILETPDLRRAIANRQVRVIEQPTAPPAPRPVRKQPRPDEETNR